MTPSDAMVDAKTPLNEFLDATAARQPTPGGGAVAALAGALAASMGEMAVNYSIGKKGLAAHEPTLREALAELNRARQLLMQLMVEDQQAYEALSAAKKLPQTSPERQKDFEIALLACVRVPQGIGTTALAVLELADRLADKTNPYLRSDLAVCCELSMATIRCAAYNVRANLADVTDPADCKSIEKSAQQLIDRARPIIQRAIPLLI